MTVYQNDEKIGEDVVVLPLAKYIGGKQSYSHDGFGLEPGEVGYAVMVRAMVRRAMVHPDRDLREAAFEALSLVYGKDFLVPKGDGTMEANRQFVSAITRMAENKSDQKLRARAQRVLDTLDQRVHNATRRMQRRTDGPGS